jgi:hypothetical protein
MPKAPKGKSDDNKAILEYALGHLERELDGIQAKIDHIKRQVGAPTRAAAPAAQAAEEDTATSEPAATRKKRVLSPAARKRIALAQKRRWAEHRKAKGAKAA